MLDHHGPQAFGGGADRGGEPGRAAPTTATSKTSPGEIGLITPKASAISAFEGLISAGRSAPNRSTTTGRSGFSRPSSASICRACPEVAS